MGPTAIGIVARPLHLCLLLLLTRIDGRLATFARNERPMSAEPQRHDVHHHPRAHRPQSARLRCMSCAAVPGDTTQLDQFRVRQGLTEPWCELEPVECAPQQDTCVTVSMQVAPHRFWIGAGCDQRVNYDVPADRDGCVDLQTFTRSVQPGFMEERRAFQQVCLCSTALCNRSRRSTAAAWSLLALSFVWVFR